MFVQPQVPIFYGTGTADIIVPPLGPIGMYYKTTHAGKVIAEITGATHFEPNTIGPNRWTPYAAAYFGCYLYSLSDACDTIYGSGGSSLCSAVPMTLCKHTPPPSSLNQAEAPVDDHSAPMNELMSSSFIVADMHDGDQKSITMSKIDQAHAKMTIKPYANNQTWIVETILTLSEAAVVGVVDFQVPGKPGPPPCNLTVSLMYSPDPCMLHMFRKGMHGPQKRALEFTDHTGTISKDPKVPLNTWVELTM